MMQQEKRTGRALVWGSVLAVAGFVLWAQWAELDQITRTNGQVIASSRNQVIQVPEGGVLAEMPVREGGLVKRGQLLARFDKTKAEAGYLESQAKLAALSMTMARLQAEVFGRQLVLPGDAGRYPEFRDNQMALYRKRQSALQEEVQALESARQLVKEELEMNQPLLKTGDVSRAEVIKLQRQLVDVQAQITNRRNKFLQDAQTELVKAQEDLASAQQIAAQRKEQLDFTEVRSPMDGVVRNVRLTTLGGVARPGEEIMQIVPADDDLIVEAKVRPADIAFVKPGLPATVKMDAYDYSIYGVLNGKVAYISADTLNEDVRGNEQPYYRVQIKTTGRNLAGRENEKIDITPGMTATVEIKTGQQTVLRYLTKPVTKTVRESMGER
ncbi:HlyD family type I secretion periplasmic adaptor subunit [Lacisediminimonas sp.]|uniref:HlyD family type I secretion periplasmic adaptor subunit n=1 Tax=Lacisediminimonas sp. TaxID=3060582 RepID=UPI002722294E|nr:HlyD family type I secretion periplasmic adaptor subunit [Lacisediminimonas sp.]MDO8300119.1 HlyD family type I secretion periplasmic adaptor subunit [Lacisediminimonas sp.]